jgi:hypothetical protein
LRKNKITWEELDWTFTMSGYTNFNITIYALYNEVGRVTMNTRDILSVPAVLGDKKEKKIFFYLENIENNEIIGEIKLEFDTRIYDYNDDNSHTIMHNSDISLYDVTDQSLIDSPGNEIKGIYIYLYIYIYIHYICMFIYIYICKCTYT